MGESSEVTAAPSTAAPAGHRWTLSVLRARIQPPSVVCSHGENWPFTSRDEATGR